MNEREQFVPKLEVSQEEFQTFSQTVKELLGKNPLGHKEYPVIVDGEEKIADIGSTNDGDMTSIWIIDKEPLSSDNSTYVYEKVFFARIFGRFGMIYEQGACRKNSYGVWRDTGELTNDPNELMLYFLNSVKGYVLRSAIDGEPIDEFRKMQSVVEQIKQTEQAKSRTIFGRARKLFRGR